MGNRRTGLGDGEAAWTSSRTIRLVCMPALIGFVTAMIMVTMMTAYSSAATEMGVLKTTHAMFTEMFQRTTRKHALFGPSLHRSSSQDEQSEVVEEETVESDDAWLKDTAIVTLAAGDTSGKNAVALMKSLRDAGTKVPNLVVLLSRGGLGSDDCNNNEWRVKNKRVHIACQHLDTIAPEIISQRYLDDFDAMGVQYYPVNPIPDTDYTIIPGGRQFFWGMAFNKLLVFNMTQYRKLIWMDADAYVVKNIDHLMTEPMLTGAFVAACCHPGGPAYAGGGIWVVEPSVQVANEIQAIIEKPVPGTVNDPWHWGDMQVVRHYFGKPPPKDSVEPYWPAINDGRHGYVPGLRHMPKYSNMTVVEFDTMIDGWLDRGKPRREGFIPELWNESGRAAWRALDIRYDQCVGHCQCSPERDAPDVVFSVHFSCLHDVGKPGGYGSENDFMLDLYTYAEGCTRYWFKRWYATFTSIHGRYPEPHWTGPELPGHNDTHDEIIMANRRNRK